jgi:hypothetical protein
MVKLTASMAANLEWPIVGVPAELRLTAGPQMAFTLLNGSTPCRIDLEANGDVQLVNSTGRVLGANEWFALNLFWSIL